MRLISTLMVLLVVVLSTNAQGDDSEAKVGTDGARFVVTFAETEVFTAAAEFWSPAGLLGGNYWAKAHFGVSFGLHAYQEVVDAEPRHVQGQDYALGFAMDSAKPGTLGLRSVFLAGGATMDRHAKGPGVDRDPTSFGFFDTRQSVAFVPPTHEGQTGSAATSLELGVGFRWNFIGDGRDLRAGDTRIREMQVYPFLAADMYL